MTQILPDLFLGDMELAKNKDGLDYIKCTHVLQTTNAMEPSFPEVLLKLNNFLTSLSNTKS